MFNIDIILDTIENMYSTIASLVGMELLTTKEFITG